LRIEAREIAKSTCGNEVALDVLDSDIYDTLNPQTTATGRDDAVTTVGSELLG
jgi:hypothetical protein